MTMFSLLVMSAVLVVIVAGSHPGYALFNLACFISFVSINLEFIYGSIGCSLQCLSPATHIHPEIILKRGCQLLQYSSFIGSLQCSNQESSSPTGYEPNRSLRQKICIVYKSKPRTSQRWSWPWSTLRSTPPGADQGALHQASTEGFPKNAALKVPGLDLHPVHDEDFDSNLDSVCMRKLC